MFKRAQRKRKRREEEEALGIDGELRDIFGAQDTDSDETEAEFEETSDAGTDHGELDNLTNGEQNSDVDHDSTTQGEARKRDSRNADPPLCVQEALRDPIYLISLEPEVKGCIICKGKLMKNGRMVILHEQSSAHQRRFAHFESLAKRADLEDNAWDIVQSVRDGSIQTQDATISKRAQKRTARLGSIKSKRQSHEIMKAKAKSKKEKQLQDVVFSTAAEKPSNNMPGKERELNDDFPEKEKKGGRKVKRKHDEK